MPERLPHVLRHYFDRTNTARVAASLLRLLGAAQLYARSPECLFPRLASPHIFIRLLLQMKLEFVCQFRFRRLPAEQGFQSIAQIGQHHFASAVSKTAATAVASLRHESASAESCFRPAALIS